MMNGEKNGYVISRVSGRNLINVVEDLIYGIEKAHMMQECDII
jgi:hypothetical protein